MKSFLIKWIAVLAIYAYSFQLTKVIEIMTWDPALDINPNDAENLPDNLKEVLEDSYNRGKMLSEEDTEGFYLSLQEKNMQFFAPNSFTGYAVSFANFEGLLADQSNLHYPQVEDLVKKLSIKKAYPDSQDEYTLEVADDEMGSTFRVIENSLLLESSRFDCLNKNKYIQSNIKETPGDIEKACMAAAETEGKSVTVVLQELMDLYRSNGENRNVNLENCVEQFTLSTYFSNDVLIKINSGELLHEVSQILNSTQNTTTKFFSYMTQNEVFLGVLTVMQKVARSLITHSGSTISYNLYWGSLQNFRTKLSLEMYHNSTSDVKKVKVRISDWGGVLLFSMDITLERFLSEIAPFLVTDYNHFQKVCNSEVSSNIDVKMLLLPTDYTQRFNNLTTQLTLLVAAICVVIVLLTIVFKSMAKKKKEKSKSSSREEDNGSFQIIRNEDYNHDDSPESKELRVLSVKDDESNIQGI